MSSAPSGFDRPVHGLERVWLVADALAGTWGDPPFVNQQVVEGDVGTALTSDRLSVAVARAAAGWPGLGAHLRGGGRWSRWRATSVAPLPGFRVVDGTAWDGRGPGGAPWLLHRLDPTRGPLAEVLHVPVCADGVPRIVVRTHHAMVDGRAAGAFTADLFRVLRGEEPCGAGSGPFDLSLAGTPSAAPAADATPVLRPTVGCSPTWQRLTWVGSTHEILPRVLLALARASDAPDGARWRFSVPTDLRLQLHSVSEAPSDTPTSGPRVQIGVDTRHSCANLTGLLRVELGRGDTSSIVRARIEASRREAGSPLHAAHALRDVPLALLGWFGQRGAEALTAEGRSEASATVSNLGRADLDALGCPGWRSTRSWWIPPGSRGSVCFVSLAGSPSGLELVASAPVSVAALARYLSRVGAALDGDFPSPTKHR